MCGGGPTAAQIDCLTACRHGIAIPIYMQRTENTLALLVTQVGCWPPLLLFCCVNGGGTGGAPRQPRVSPVACALALAGVQHRALFPCRRSVPDVGSPKLSSRRWASARLSARWAVFQQHGRLLMRASCAYRLSLFDTHLKCVRGWGDRCGCLAHGRRALSSLWRSGFD